MSKTVGECQVVCEKSLTLKTIMQIFVCISSFSVNSQSWKSQSFH